MRENRRNNLIRVKIMGSINTKVPKKKKVITGASSPKPKKPSTTIKKPANKKSGQGSKPAGGVPRKPSTPRETGGRKLSKRSTGVRRG